MLERIRNPAHEVTIGFVGKYVKHRDAYKSVYESLDHAGIHHNAQGASRADRVGEARGRRGSEAARRTWTGCSCPAGSTSAASRGRSTRSGSPARTGCRSSASASACSAPRSSSPGTSSGSRTRTAPSSTRQRRTRSSACSTSSGRSRRSAGRCGSGRTSASWRPGRGRTRPSGRRWSRERHRHRYEVNNDYRDQTRGRGHACSRARARTARWWR